ncbi:peptidase S24 [Nostocoides sp. F2B08]|nr:peptidase S24 [Tetrasphaera sp. F2B08]
MEPTLRADDVVLVWWGACARPDALVVFEHPERQGLLLVKRAVHRDPEDTARWWVERDNVAGGSDSWTLGSIADSDILGRVVTRLPRALTRG